MVIKRIIKGTLALAFGAVAASALVADHQMSRDQGRGYSDMGPISRLYIENICQQELMTTRRMKRDEAQSWCLALLPSAQRGPLAQTLEEGRQGLAPLGAAFLLGAVLSGAAAVYGQRPFDPSR
jgi:hypothetical protein